MKDKKILIVIAFKGYQDTEYGVPRKILEDNGARIMAASSSLGEAEGLLGSRTEVGLLVSEAKAENFDAVLFVGGPGAPEYLDNQASYNLAEEAVEKGKILGAICIAPTILAKAGVLKGRKATVWCTAINKGPVKILEENGAEYVPSDVVADGNIITASGPKAAEEFGLAIAALLSK